ncbi:MAG: PilZ domain-containing protein [Hyphomicrobiaceae bacterium]
MLDLIRDLSRLPRNDGAHEAVSSVAEPGLDAEALLLRALVQEVHTAALLTAAACTAMNVATTPQAPKALSDAHGLVANFPARLEDWPNRILEEQLTEVTLQSIAVFYSLFQQSRSRMLAFEREATSIGLDRAGAVHLVPLTRGWRLAARHASIAVQALTEEATYILPETYQQNVATLTLALDHAIAGRPALLDTDGRIVLPVMAERRRTPRRSLLQTAHLRIANTTVLVYARDVSVGGIGLANVPPLPPSDTALIELSCGRVLRGKIAWQDDGNAGLRFERPLKPTDPLIFG